MKAATCVLLGVLLTVVSAGGPVWAQARSPLVVRMEPLSIRPRTGALIPVDWTLIWNGPGLLRGHFHVGVYDGQQRLAHIVSEELVIANDDRTFRMMFPSVVSSNQFSETRLELSFIDDEEEKLDLEEVTLRVPSPSSRSLTMCICDFPRASLSDREHRLVDSLEIDRFSPSPIVGQLYQTPTYFLPRDFPSDPLELCSFDVAVLTGEGFSRLSQKQLTALLDWIAAGGSLCLLTGGDLQVRHRQFLNGIAAAHSDSPPFLLSAEGRLVHDSGVSLRSNPGHPPGDDRPDDDKPDDDKQAGDKPDDDKPDDDKAAGDKQADDKQAGDKPADNKSDDGRGDDRVRMFRKGLGRAVIVIGGVENGPAFRSPGWRTAVAFLWKFRRDEVKNIAQTGKWSLQKPEVSEAAKALIEKRFPGANLAPSNPGPLLLYPHPLPVGDGLLKKMMPEGVKVVPFSVIGTILLLYVVIAGPVDYLVLGLFKRRWLTWGLFPLLTIACTVFTVRLSHAYLESSKQKKAVVIRDVGENGTVVRKSQYELFFNSIERNEVSEQKRTILTPVNYQRYSSVNNRHLWANRRGSEFQLNGMTPDDWLVDAAVYSGRIPLRYTVSQRVPQWTPHIQRTFSIDPQPSNVEFDWETVAYPSNSAERVALQARVVAAFGEGALTFLFRNRDMTSLTPRSRLFPRNISQPSSGYMYYDEIEPRGQIDFLQAICVRPGGQDAFQAGNFFSIVSQISPTGGDHFEDLTILDPSDDDQWLLVIAVERGGEVMLYRKLYVTSKP